MTLRRIALLLSVLLVSFIGPAHADGAGPDTVMIEDLTWPEIKARMDAGAATIIVPTGGTEQNGPHMVLGKHNTIVRYTSEQIARRVGDTMVAPVLAYVPEGGWDPPEGHMRFPGTISLPDTVFEAVLESTARSFAAEGFNTILFLGDSGGNQGPQERVAQRLDAEFQRQGIRVFQIGDYYARNGQVDWLKSQGFTGAEVGGHAGLVDTAQLMAIDPRGVAMGLLTVGTDGKTGVTGDPSRATTALGKQLLELKIAAAVRQIRQKRAAGP